MKQNDSNIALPAPGEPERTISFDSGFKTCVYTTKRLREICRAVARGPWVVMEDVEPAPQLHQLVGYTEEGEEDEEFETKHLVDLDDQISPALKQYLETFTPELVMRLISMSEASHE